MAGFIYPNVYRFTIVNAIKTPFETAVMRLFKTPIAFTPLLALTDLTPIEADFTGYAGITLTTLPAAFLDPINGGISFDVPTVQWNCGSPLLIANNIFGGWMETSGGVLMMAWQIQTPWVMDAPLKALPLGLTFNWFGTGAVYVDILGIPQ